MSIHQALLQRREFLLMLAGLSITPVNFAETIMTSDDHDKINQQASHLDQAPHAPGKAGDFDFLQGEWKIAHQRPKANSPGEWDHFEGEATCWSILGGIASIEELRIPSRNFSGMGLRLLDREQQVWSDFWVNAKNGVLVSPGVSGGFRNGVGTFISSEEVEGKTVLIRGMWDQITAHSCRWQQASSKDGGVSWETDWIMHWRRV